MGNANISSASSKAKHYMKTICLIFFVLMLNACGGGASNSNSSPNNSQTPTPSPTPTTTQVPTVTPTPTLTPTPAPTRTFYMGFTPWPYDATLDAVNFTYDRIQEHGDMVKHHLMQGVPWDAAYTQSTYPTCIFCPIMNTHSGTR